MRTTKKGNVITIVAGLTFGLFSVGANSVVCDSAATAGGGTLGLSPGASVGAPNSLGWDVGSGQCNGSFSVYSDPVFPGGALELAIRAEERRVGQVDPSALNDYTVNIGYDDSLPIANNRAWWNFQLSMAYGASLATLDSLTLEIITDVGPNGPSSPIVDLLAFRGFIDDRNNQPNATAGFADLYQISQNPEFGWFAPASDTDTNPTGAFDYSTEGAWRFRLTATKDGSSAQLVVCIHTPGAVCAVEELADDHYLSYKAKRSKGTDKFEKLDVTLTDILGSGVYRVEHQHDLLAPVDKNDEGISDEDTHLVSYHVKGDRLDAEISVEVTNQFGTFNYDIKDKADRLLVPASKGHGVSLPAPDLGAIAADHFLCYKIEKAEKLDIVVSISDQFQSKMVKVHKAKKMCNPVDKNGEGIKNADRFLVCYDVKKIKGEPKFSGEKGLVTNDQFGELTVDVKKERELCVPSSLESLLITDIIDDDDDDDDD